MANRLIFSQNRPKMPQAIRSLRHFCIVNITHNQIFKTMAAMVLNESFRVKTTGYTEQFSNYNSARQVFDKLKRQKMKEGYGGFKITLQRKTDESGWDTLDSIHVKD